MSKRASSKSRRVSGRSKHRRSSGGDGGLAKEPKHIARPHRRRSTGKKRQHSTARPVSGKSADALYHKGRTSQINDDMSLSTLQGIAWRNGIPFGGLNKQELIRKIHNTTRDAN